MILSKEMFPMKPDKVDGRNFTLETPLMGSQGDPEDYELPIAEILNQGSYSTCSGFSMRGLMRSSTGLDLSATYPYGNREDGDYMGEGETMLEAMKDWLRDGSCNYENMISNGTVSECVAAFRALSQDIHDEAHENRIEGFYSLPKPFALHHQIMGSTRMYSTMAIPIYHDAMLKAMETGYLEPPQEGDEMIGGHMVYVSGKRGDYTIVPQSWGDKYFDKGVMYMHRDYPIWSVIMPVPWKPVEVRMNQDEKWYTVNGVQYEMDTVPKTVSNRVHVPVRFIMDAIGRSYVVWDDDKRTATINYLGKKLYFTESMGYFTDSYTYGQVFYDVGLSNVIDENGRMQIPVRTVMEYLGFKVDYDPETRDITMTKIRKER